jgi:hypothetical protein
MLVPPTLPLLMLVAPALLAGALVPDARAQGSSSSLPKEVRGQKVTDRGEWHGTWTYVNRDGRTALWIDTSGETTRVRMQFQGTTRPEGFVTDWDGHATYIFAGQPGTFEIAITDAGENRIDGTWFWDIQFEDVGRSERGSFSLLRVGDGRQMVMDFSEYERVLRQKEKTSRYDGAIAWSFKKVSKRIASWDEVF